MTNPNITIDDLVAYLGGVTPNRWAGNCAQLANAVVEGFPELGGRFQYGHWVGPIYPDSHFADRASLGFTHHAWVLLPDGTILDPTRWVFESASPYVFVGGSEHYDHGGNQLRTLMMKPTPKASYEERNRVIKHFVEDDLFVLNLASHGVINDNRLSTAQLFWIANLPFDALLGRHKSIYSALEVEGCKAMIPVDNYNKAFEK